MCRIVFGWRAFGFCCWCCFVTKAMLTPDCDLGKEGGESADQVLKGSLALSICITVPPRGSSPSPGTRPAAWLPFLPEHLLPSSPLKSFALGKGQEAEGINNKVKHGTITQQAIQPTENVHEVLGFLRVMITCLKIIFKIEDPESQHYYFKIHLWATIKIIVSDC